MLKVPLKHAVPGMTLAVPLHHPQQFGRILLRTGYVLDWADIERLAEIELPNIWIRYPSLDFVAEYINPAAIALQHEIASAIDQTFERVADNHGVELNYEEFRDTIDKLVEQFTDQPQSALFIDEICAGGKAHIAHAANVCSLSLLMGLRLESYVVSQRPRLVPRFAKNVVNLGVGAMLHDIGMLQLPPDVLERWARTGDESDPAFRAHARLGYNAVREHIGPGAASVILNHHQRMDGSGFPSKMEADGVERATAGTRIPIFSRIVAVADIYDRLRHPPDGSPSRPAVEVLHTMRAQPWASRIDQMVFKALVTVAPPYPPGSIVGLSDGTTGVVTDWSIPEPCRPTVRLIDDPGLQFAITEENAPVVDLTQDASLHVILAEDQDVSAFNFYASREDDFDVDEAQAQQWRTLIRSSDFIA